MEVARVPLTELARGILAGRLHNDCLVVGVLAVLAARAGDGLTRCAPRRRPGRRGPSRPERGRRPGGPGAGHPASAGVTIC